MTSGLAVDVSVTASAMDIDELLCCAGRGDLEAFRELYDETCARVFGLARRLAVDSTRAQDITQDAYLDIWRRAPRFNPEASSAIGWILMITHARAVDHIRTAERIRKYDQDDLNRAHPGGSHFDHTVETVLSKIKPTALVHDALARLTPLQRQAIHLTYWGELTGPEASRMLGVSLPTFKARLQSAMHALRTTDALMEPAHH